MNSPIQLELDIVTYSVKGYVACVERILLEINLCSSIRGSIGSNHNMVHDGARLSLCFDHDLTKTMKQHIFSLKDAQHDAQCVRLQPKDATI